MCLGVGTSGEVQEFGFDAGDEKGVLGQGGTGERGAVSNGGRELYEAPGAAETQCRGAPGPADGRTTKS